jgi:hypothetical protein
MKITDRTAHQNNNKLQVRRGHKSECCDFYKLLKEHILRVFRIFGSMRDSDEKLEKIT